MSKQDRQGSRTPADVQRRVGGSLAGVSRTAADAQKRAESAEKEVLNLKNKKISIDQLDIDGQELNIKVASTNIKGKLTSEQIDATNLKVEAANIEGTLDADQINADGLTVKEGTIGEWTLGMATIPISEKATITESALYSGVQMRELEDGDQWYTCETWLTARGVYCVYKHYYAEDGGIQPAPPTETTYYSKKWWELLKD